MATLKQIEFASFGPYKIIGKQIRTQHAAVNPIFQSYPTIPSLWKQCFSDGTFEELLKMDQFIPLETHEGYVGYSRDYREDGTFTYLVGWLMNGNTPVPEGYCAYDIPACTLAKAWIEGEEYDIYPNAQPLTVEAIERNGFVVDWENYFACEYYTHERFGAPQRNGTKVLVLDYYIPCKKLG